MGGLGAMTVSTAAGKVLTGSGPQGIFGSFLGKQKGTRLPLSNITKANQRNSVKTGKIF